MKKLFIAAVLLSLLVSSKASAASFTDVTTKHGSYEEISYLSGKGIINGYSDGTFKPGNFVTKQQVAVMMYRTLKWDDEVIDPGYSDISTKHPAYKEIALATQHGLFDSAKRFKPSEYITRQEMARVLAKGFKLKGDQIVRFSDITSVNKYYTDVQLLVANNITVGIGTGLFGPKNNLTRAQFSTFLARVLNADMKPEPKIYNNMGMVPRNYTGADEFTYVYNGDKTFTETMKYKDFAGSFENGSNYSFVAIQGSSTNKEHNNGSASMGYYDYATHFYYMNFKFPTIKIDFPITVGSVIEFDQHIDTTSSLYMLQYFNINEIINLGLDYNNFNAKLVKTFIEVVSTKGTLVLNEKKYEELVVVQLHTQSQKNLFTYYFGQDIGLVKIEGPGFTYELQ